MVEKPSESGISDGSQPYEGWPMDLQGPPDRSTGKRRKKRRVFGNQQSLSINSLMDIVTILLVYLIKSYATSPIDIKDPAIRLPTSTSQENVEEAAVVMVTGPVKEVIDPDTHQVSLVANTPTLIVDGEPLFPLKAVQGAGGEPSWRIPKEQKDPPEEKSFVVSTLAKELEEARETQEATATLTDRDFTGKVVILADKRTPYRVLMDLLVTCGQAGFGEFKFAIVKDEG